MPTLKLDEVNVSYVQYGNGPVIVWIPGGDQRGVHFAEQYEAFPDFRNTAYDPRGVGETLTHIGPPWTIPALARDCAALIRKVCRPPVVLTGLSMGSLVVQPVVGDVTKRRVTGCAQKLNSGATVASYRVQWRFITMRPSCIPRKCLAMMHSGKNANLWFQVLTSFAITTC